MTPVVAMGWMCLTAFVVTSVIAIMSYVPKDDDE